MHERRFENSTLRRGRRDDRRDREPDELPDELAAHPQDQAIWAVELPPVPVRDRHVELHRLQRAGWGGDGDRPRRQSRQDDYDIWLGTNALDDWIKWNRHGTSSNVLYLDGHAKSITRGEAYLAMYPGGQVLKVPSFYPK